MSLYGLDIIIEDEFNLIEVNGVNSGMKGFRELYGDDRTRETVYSMLEDEYGFITLNDGVFPGREPIKPLEYVNRFSESLDRIARAPPQIIRNSFPFEPYRGQESTVFNFVNQRIEEEQVNDYEVSEMIKNDFLLSRLLKDTWLEEYFPETAPLVKEAAESGHIVDVARMSETMFIKPAKGYTGIGVETISQGMYNRVLNHYVNLWKAEEDVPLYRSSKKPFRMGEFVENESYEYERALGVIQPMLGTDKEEYGCVRAIVCNGEYVDSYERVSNSKIVNYTNGAEAREFEEPEGFEEFCEEVVEVLEQGAEELGEEFRETLYRSYLE